MLYKRKEVVIIGWINTGNPAICGETMKNQLMIKKLEEFNIKCHIMDFYQWRKRPWIILQLAWTIMIHRKATIIFSTSAQNVYPMMKFMKRIRWKQHTIHWVIGGSLAEKVTNGTFSRDVINYMNWTLVESPIMMKQLSECGVKHVIQTPNFKPINYIPPLTRNNEKMRFVFLSRIMPEKGCNYIFESANLLNKKGLKNTYDIDFYGKIASEYEEEFKKKIDALENVNYAGFLNLCENKGYDRLASYDLMLFPTYWKGEGFAGILIDAFIAGLPLIATDWAHNRQFMKEGETALFVPVHDIPALTRKMEECILKHFDLKVMARNCQKEASKYNIENVITIDFLKKIDII